MDESLRAEERIELRELFAARLEGTAQALLEYETPADAERITMQLLLHFQDEAAPPEAIEDAIAALEARADRAAAIILATAERLLAPSIAEPAGEALAGLHRAGIEDEAPPGTGELRVASVRRFDGIDGEIYLATLERPTAEADQQAAVAIERTDSGARLEGGGLGPPGEELEVDELPEEDGEAPEGSLVIDVSADELHAVLRDAVARHRRLGVSIPNEVGLALPVLWLAAGGDPAELAGIAVAPPGEDVGTEGTEELLPSPPPSASLPYLAMSAPRNAACPCGSGAKAKRCCLPRTEALRREAAALEDMTMELADRAWAVCPRCYDAAVARVFRGAEERLGHLELLDCHRLEAALWIIWAGGLCEGRPAPLDEHLEKAGTEGLGGRLAEAQIRAWRVESADESTGLIVARCPVSGEPAELEAVRSATPEPIPGSLLVARSLPRPEGRFALLGSAPVVEPEAQEDFERLLEGLADQTADPDELWRRHGGELLSAAWCWPEMRDYTVEGEPAEEHYVALSVADCEALEERLATGERMVEGRSLGGGERVATFSLLRGEEAAPPEMPAEPGVDWVLCDEDAASPPHLAEIELDLDREAIWVFAPSGTRCEAALRELRELAGELLGAVIERDREELPSISRRWQRDRVEAALSDDALRRLSEAA